MNDDDKLVQSCISLPKSYDDKLREMAKADHRSKSAVIRLIIIKELDAQEQQPAQN